MSILYEIPPVGEVVQLHGEGHGAATVLAHNPLSKTVVIHFRGYSANPGSRYSGLRSYYPAHAIVYRYGPHDHFEALKLEPLVEWETGKKRR
jgi:hypothetical protein